MFDELVESGATLERVAAGFDPARLDSREAVGALAELARIRKIVDGLVGKVAKRIQDSGAYLDAGAPDAASFVGTILGVPARSARAAITVATALESLPATDAAVRAGELSARQTEMIVKTAPLDPDAEAQLLAAAAHGLTPLRDACIAVRAGVEDAEARRVRHHRDRSLRVWTDSDGMVAGYFRLAPEIGGQLKALLDAETQRIFRSRRSGGDHERLDSYAADALANIMLGGGGTVDVRMHVVVDYAALMRGGTAPGETCEIPGVGAVNVAWARELLGSAFLTAIIKHGKDIHTVAHLGRHVPAEVQTALLVSGRECSIEDCHERGYLERDHVDDHALGGETSYRNLTWMCSRHHDMKTKGFDLGPPDPVTGKRKLRPPPARAA